MKFMWPAQCSLGGCKVFPFGVVPLLLLLPPHEPTPKPVGLQTLNRSRSGSSIKDLADFCGCQKKNSCFYFFLWGRLPDNCLYSFKGCSAYDVTALGFQFVIIVKQIKTISCPKLYWWAIKIDKHLLCVIARASWVQGSKVAKVDKLFNGEREEEREKEKEREQEKERLMEREGGRGS